MPEEVLILFSVFASCFLWCLLIFGSVYISLKLVSPGVKLISVDAQDGTALVELTNRKKYPVTFDLVDVMVTFPFLSLGGIERMFNVTMQPKEKRLLKIRMSRAVPEEAGKSRYYNVAVTAYSGPGWFRMRSYFWSWWKKITMGHPGEVLQTVIVQEVPPVFVAQV